MKLINPYNFVPLSDKGPKRTAWQEVSKHHRLSEASYSGYFMLRILTVTPVFTPSYLPEDVVKEPVQTKFGVQHKRTYKRFYHQDGRPIIPGTSIKGMIRSAFEALTDSCMAMFAGTYGKRSYPAGSYKHEECNPTNGLCPACAVFGTIQEKEFLLQGKVRFSDALGECSSIEKGNWILKPMLAPKPERHVPFYAANGNNPASGPKGRKFYYHHDPTKVFQNMCTAANEHSHLNARILELLKPQSSLTSRVDFFGLTREQLSYLLYSIELEYRTWEAEGKKKMQFLQGHKIGMGKPLGFGSVAIFISDGIIMNGASPYISLAMPKSNELRDKINELRLEMTQPPSNLFRELFSLNKKEGNIVYPDQNWFRTNNRKELPESGVFDDRVTVKLH